MSTSDQHQHGMPDIALRAWSEDDLELLVAANSPGMTAHLGGPETDDKVADRHRRYLETAEADSVDRMFAVVLRPTGEKVAVVGYWHREWRDEPVYETGWSVLPAFQGRGIARTAVRQALDLARLEARFRYVHAFPSTTNAPSNALCRSIGFELLGECDFEYPPGHPMRCNDWRLDLQAPATQQPQVQP